MRDRFFHGTMAAILLAFVAVAAVGMPLARLYFDAHQLVSRVAILGTLVGLLVGVAYRAGRRGMESLRIMAIILAWTFTIGEVHVIPMFMIARTGAPVRDDLLARADHALGVDLPAVMEWMGRHPSLQAASGLAYGSLLVLSLLPGLVPTFRGDAGSAKRFVVANVAAGAISYPIMGLLPAVGPWAYYGYRPQIPQEEYMALLARLRTSQSVLLDHDYRSGLICFPSFHTIVAVLSAAALWSTPRFRWVAAAWAALVVVSTVTTGSHYVVDVVAGLLIATLAQLIARRFSAREARSCDERGHALPRG